MFAVSKPTTGIQVSRRPVSTLAIVTLFSLAGLALSLALPHHGIDIASGL